MRGEISGGLLLSVDIHSAWLVFVSSKTMRTVKTQSEPKYIGRRSTAECTLLDDLVSWCVQSGTLDEDELLTRYAGRDRRSITRKDVATALKAGAEAIGEDPSRFSTKSLRGGFSTAALEAHIPDEEINLRGGWTLGSKVPRDFYASQGGLSRGGMAIIGDGCLASKP